MNDPRRPPDAETEPDMTEEEGRAEEPILEDLEDEEGVVGEDEAAEDDMEDEDEPAPDRESQRKTA